MQRSKPESITFVAFDGVQSLDITGPWEAFHVANDALAAVGRAPTYDLRLVGTTPQIATASGLRLSVDPLPPRATGTVLVPGGEGARTPDPALLTWLGKQRPVRLLTVCTGAFLAGMAGLLHGRTITTHWAYADVLAQAARLSPRQFQRRFAAEVGVSVGEYVQAARIEVAKSLLVSTDSTVESVARDSGFASPEGLRRGFQIRCGTSPTAYRRQFSKRSAP